MQHVAFAHGLASRTVAVSGNAAPQSLIAANTRAQGHTGSTAMRQTQLLTQHSCPTSQLTPQESPHTGNTREQTKHSSAQEEIDFVTQMAQHAARNGGGRNGNQSRTEQQAHTGNATSNLKQGPADQSGTVEQGQQLECEHRDKVTPRAGASDLMGSGESLGQRYVTVLQQHTAEGFTSSPLPLSLWPLRHHSNTCTRLVH